MSHLRFASVVLILSFAMAAEQSPEVDWAWSFLGEELILRFAIDKTHFALGEPIIVDLQARNTSEKSISMISMHPLSSMMAPPAFLIKNSDGNDHLEFWQGFHSDWKAWSEWYQPGRNGLVSEHGRLEIGPGETLHILHGDLRDLLLKARDRSISRLSHDECVGPEDDKARQRDRHLVRFVEQFLKGGSFGISVMDHSLPQSPVIEITVGPEKVSNSAENPAPSGCWGGR